MPHGDQYIRRLLATCLLLIITLPTQATSVPFLVTTHWLEQHLYDDNIVIVDMSDSFQYQRFHIPGARHLPYGVLNQQNRQHISYSVGPELIANILGQLGVTPQQSVIIYDDVGGLNAARLYWELQRLGHHNVSLLDGGLVKWIREGRNLSWQAKQVKPQRYAVGNSASADLANRSDLTTASIILDVRTQEEYLGHPRQPRSGHIPGARHFPWDTAVRFDNDFAMQSAPVLKASLAKLGITDSSQEIVLYCRSGHRAAHTYFTLKRLGWKSVRVYDGSMAEYERDLSAPLRQGSVP